LKATTGPEDKGFLVFKVRAATSEDAEELARMRLALQQHMQASNPHLLPMSRQAIANLPKQYRLHLENPMRRIIVAEDRSGVLIGMSMGMIADRDDLQPPRCGRIDDVWVESHWRRQGLAKQLIGNLVAFFESKDVATVVLEYSVGNTEAECAWNAIGFEPILTVAVATPYQLRQRL
jgi:ribosomal protein S18 acetylase RimI-like enzyme